MVIVTIGGMNQCIGYHDSSQEGNIAYLRAIGALPEPRNFNVRDVPKSKSK